MFRYWRSARCFWGFIVVITIVLTSACRVQQEEMRVDSPQSPVSENNDNGSSPSNNDANNTANNQAEPGQELPSGTSAIEFGASNILAGNNGRDGFTFGVSTAATQIEDLNGFTDWYRWSQPAPEGLGQGVFIGDASQGYSRALDDIDLLVELGVDAYRFSIEWARIEPERGVIDDDALAHYDAFIDKLVDNGIRPIITIHHFSNPVWVDDPADKGCENGPTDANLCGWDHPEGASLVIEAISAHAQLLAQRFGDRVDEWLTFNEPINYLLAAYGIGEFPPGKTVLLSSSTRFVGVIRNVVEAHSQIYDAIKEGDNIDASGDGINAHIGLSLSVADWVPARNNRPSIEPEDIAATERVRYVYHELIPESLLRGAFDPDVNRSFSESQPGWQGKLDWLGVQYYFRAGVTGSIQLIPVVRAAVCAGVFDLGACIPPEDLTHYVPAMGYEYYAQGLYSLLKSFGKKWPDLPLTVTESGIATDVVQRRQEHIVRSLEQIYYAIYHGVDVRGYFHWSLMDNYEWAHGYEPRFGLYRLDWDTYERLPTAASELYGQIARQRGLTSQNRVNYGGIGSMTPEAN